MTIPPRGRAVRLQTGDPASGDDDVEFVLNEIRGYFAQRTAVVPTIDGTPLLADSNGLFDCRLNLNQAKANPADDFFEIDTLPLFPNIGADTTKIVGGSYTYVVVFNSTSLSTGVHLDQVQIRFDFQIDDDVVYAGDPEPIVYNDVATVAVGPFPTSTQFEQRVISLVNTAMANGELTGVDAEAVQALIDASHDNFDAATLGGKALSEFRLVSESGDDPGDQADILKHGGTRFDGGGIERVVRYNVVFPLIASSGQLFRIWVDGYNIRGGKIYLDTSTSADNAFVVIDDDSTALTNSTYDDVVQASGWLKTGTSSDHVFWFETSNEYTTFIVKTMRVHMLGAAINWETVYVAVTEEGVVYDV